MLLHRHLRVAESRVWLKNETLLYNVTEWDVVQSTAFNEGYIAGLWHVYETFNSQYKRHV